MASSKDQNEIEVTVVILDCTITSELSKRLIPSAKANKKPFNLYNTICFSHFYKPYTRHKKMADEKIICTSCIVGDCNSYQGNILIVALSFGFCYSTMIPVKSDRIHKMLARNINHMCFLLH